MKDFKDILVDVGVLTFTVVLFFILVFLYPFFRVYEYLKEE